MTADRNYRVYGSESRPTATGSYELAHHIMEKIYQIEERAEADGAGLEWGSTTITMEPDVISDVSFADRDRVSYYPHLRIEVTSDLLEEAEDEDD